MNQETTIKIQKELFQAIQLQFSKQPKKMMTKISEVLNLSSGAVYKRLNGTTVLSMAEFLELSKAFHLLLEDFLPHQDRVTFQFRPLVQPIRSYMDFIEPIYHDLMQLLQLENVHIYCSASEIPFFYYLQVPELAFFKLYAWGRSVWELPQLQNTSFSLSMMSSYGPELNLMTEMLDAYNQIDSTEIWHLNIIDNTVGQIKYYLDCGWFADPNEAFLLCKKIDTLFLQVKSMASVGKKFRTIGHIENAQGNLSLYNNQMFHTNNAFLVDYGKGKVLYNTLENPNFLKSMNLDIGGYMENWFNKMVKRTQAIDNTDEKQHTLYFKAIFQKIEMYKSQMKIVPV